MLNTPRACHYAPISYKIFSSPMIDDVSRREFIKSSLATAALPMVLGTHGLALASPPKARSVDEVPVIDTHIHLFDPTRPQGVPWPAKTQEKIYRPTLPPRLRTLAEPLGVRGAIHVECSPWPEDNEWVLRVAKTDPMIVGVIGNLELGQPEFTGRLEALRRDPLFLGLRAGNLWGRDLAEGINRPVVIEHLRLLGEAGLVLDTANPNLALLSTVVRVTDQVPGLRVVIDHLPGMPYPTDVGAQKKLNSLLLLLGERPHVYVKISQVLRAVKGPASRDVAAHRERLDLIVERFGIDRVMYGSDWPNSDPDATYDEILGIVRAYFQTRSPEAAENYFWRNSVAAYRWNPREPSQPRSS